MPVTSACLMGAVESRFHGKIGTYFCGTYLSWWFYGKIYSGACQTGGETCL